MYRVVTSHGHCIQMKLLSAGSGTKPVGGSGSSSTHLVYRSVQVKNLSVFCQNLFQVAW